MSGNWVKYLFGFIAVLYPLLVFGALVVFKLPIRYFSIGIVIFAIVYSVINKQHYKGKKTIGLFITPLILCCIGTVNIILGSNEKYAEFILILYPVLADLAFLIIWITSFFFPPPFAFYFIQIIDKNIKNIVPKNKFDIYCFRATLVWCLYFIIDGIIAGITIIIYYRSPNVWYIYNALITYIIMGLIFAGEYIILKLKAEKYRQKLLNREIPVEAQKNDMESENENT